MRGTFIRHAPLTAFAAAATALALFMKGFFPTDGGALGYDYTYHLPRLLAGLYWERQNGLLAVPYFSPAFCGGLPFLANPVSNYYSLPQMLALWMSPVDAVYATAVLSTIWCGLWGTMLLRHRFGVSWEAAWFGGALFLLNGFVVHRMLIGHLIFHGFALLPSAAFALMAPRRPGRVGELGAVCATGATFGYLTFSGALNLVIPFALCLVAIWLVHALLCRPLPIFWSRLALGGLLGAMVSAAKMAPAMVYVANFPRRGPMVLLAPGVLLYLLLAGLFHPALLRGVPYRWEYELALGPAAALVLAAGAFVVARDRARRRAALERLGRSTGVLLALVAVLVLPLVLSWSGPGFESLLRSIPYVKSNVVMSRWWVVWIAALVPLTAAAFDRAARRWASPAAVLGIGVSVMALLLVDRAYTELPPYDPQPIQRAAAALRSHGIVPPIVAVGGTHENDLARGISHRECYEPLFGYQRQTLPVNAPDALADPACFLYGDENACRPGDPFAPQREAARRLFSEYRQFPFVMPAWQRGANYASLFGLTFLVVGGVLAGVRRVRRRS